MRTEEFSDGTGGYCVTTIVNGREFVLSQQMKEGTHGVARAAEKIVREMNGAPTIGVRYLMLQRGIETEMQTGMQLTRGPSASARVKREYGIRTRLSKEKTLIAFQMLLQFAQMLYRERKEEEE